MTKISQLSSIGDSLAIGDQFLIRDIDDAGSPNKSVTVSGITRALADGDATAPALAFAADKNTGIYRAGTDSLAVATNGTEKLIVLSNGNVGIGISGPTEKLDVSSGTSGTASVVKIQDPAGRVLQIASPSASTEAYIGTTTNHSLDFYTNNGVKATLDSSGRLLVGTSTSTGAYYGAEGNWQGGFQVARSDVNAVASFSIWNATASTYTNFGGAQLHFSACKSGTVGSHTSGALASGDTVGSITFSPSDGTNFRNCARIEAVVDGGVSTNDVPGRLVFSTTADGSASPTERMRIRNDGQVLIGGSSDTKSGKLEVTGRLAVLNGRETIQTGSTAYTASTSATEVLEFDVSAGGFFGAELFVTLCDSVSPAGTIVQKVYVAARGSGTNVTAVSVSQSDLLRQTSETATFTGFLTWTAAVVSNRVRLSVTATQTSGAATLTVHCNGAPFTFLI